MTTNSNLRSLLPLAVTAAAALAPPAVSALDIFMKVAGIKGSSVNVSHPDEIEVISWGWGVSAPVTIAAGGSSAGTPSLQSVVITKSADKATGDLQAAVATAKKIDSVDLYAEYTNGDPAVHVLMKPAWVESSYFGAADSSPVETVSLVFQCIEITTTQYDDTGAKSGSEMIAYDANTKGVVASCP